MGQIPSRLTVQPAAAYGTRVFCGIKADEFHMTLKSQSKKNTREMFILEPELHPGGKE